MGLDMYLFSAKRANTDGVFVAGETYDEEFVEKLKGSYNVYMEEKGSRPVTKAIKDVAVPIKINVRLCDMIKLVKENPCESFEITPESTWCDFDKEDDMYIIKFYKRCSHELVHEIRLTGEEILNYEEIVPHDAYVCITDEAYYWRKANQIRGWFEAHLSEPVDNCQNSIVTKEDLEELIENCARVLGLVDEDYMSLEWDDYDMTKASEQIAEEVLPPQSGFFFGSYEYDEWYYHDLFRTLQAMTTLLNDTDWENERLYYSEWW